MSSGAVAAPFVAVSAARGVSLTASGAGWVTRAAVGGGGALPDGTACGPQVCVTPVALQVGQVMCVRAPCPQPVTPARLEFRNPGGGPVLRTVALDGVRGALGGGPLGVVAASAATRFCVNGGTGAACLDGSGDPLPLPGRQVLALLPDGARAVVTERQTFPPSDWPSTEGVASRRTLALLNLPGGTLDGTLALEGTWSVYQVTPLTGTALLVTLTDQGKARTTAYRHVLVNAADLTVQTDLTSLNPDFGAHPFVTVSPDGRVVLGGVNTVVAYVAGRRRWAQPTGTPPGQVLYSRDGSVILLCSEVGPSAVLRLSSGARAGSGPACGTARPGTLIRQGP